MVNRTRAGPSCLLVHGMIWALRWFWAFSGSLKLRSNAIVVDHCAAIDRHIEPRYRDLAVITDGEVRDHSHIAQKAAMDGNAAALPWRQFLTPIAVRDGEVDDAAHSAGVD